MTVLFPLNKQTLKGYYMAPSVEGALAYLATHRGKAQLVAGGTELMPLVQRHESRISYLVDISHIRTMKHLSQSGQSLQIGGATTMSMLQESDLVRLRAPLLYESARHLGTPKVRHLATIAGNVVSAEGNADCAVALLALDAETEITNLTGAQWLPLASLFVRPGVSRVNSTSEIMTSLRFHTLGPGQGEALCRALTAFERMAPPSPTHRSPVILALRVSLDGDGQRIDWVSVALGLAHDVPTHLTDVEDALQGMSIDDPHTPETFAAMVREQVALRQKAVSARHRAQEDAPTLADEAARLALRAYDRAAQMARNGLHV